MSITTCATCANFNGVCKLDPAMYATRPDSFLTCPYSRRREKTDQLQTAVSLLQALFDLQNGPPLEKYRDDYYEVMAQSMKFLVDMEKAGVSPTEIKPVGEGEA